MTRPPIAFTGAAIDRADNLRADPDAMAELMARPDARLLALDLLDARCDEKNGLCWEGMDRAAGEVVFLGLDERRAPCFAPVPPSLTVADLRAYPKMWKELAYLSASELAIYGGARSLVAWHALHRFCSVCGSPTRIGKGGWMRACENETCSSEHYPRVDPVTIMLIENEGDLLMGRQPRFPEKFYSALAGFVEPGETIEEAVARESFEEAGVRVRDVQYVFCQPWPFPSSLMIGCHGIADGREIVLDETELEDARWFSREEVADAMEAVKRMEAGRAFFAPPRFAIAHELLNWWLQREPA